MFRIPTLDLIASHIYHQFDTNISWKSDPKALALHAFSLKWSIELYYIFPPFSLLRKVTAKIYRDKTKVIVVIPKWPIQHWCPKLMRKVTKLMTITPSAKNVQQPQDPLHRKLRLHVLLID